MTIYQKAIKLRKICESRKTCSGCIYNSKCAKSYMLPFSPVDEGIKNLAKIIKEEKWNIK